MARFDLVIFDCDGVVVDSERIVHAVFGAFIRSLGVHLSDAEMFERFLGLRLAECMGVVEGITGQPVPPGALDALSRGPRPRAARAGATRRGRARGARGLDHSVLHRLERRSRQDAGDARGDEAAAAVRRPVLQRDGSAARQAGARRVPAGRAAHGRCAGALRRHRGFRERRARGLCRGHDGVRVRRPHGAREAHRRRCRARVVPHARAAGVAGS